MWNAVARGQREIAAGQNTKERDYWLNKLSGDHERSSFPFDTGKRPAGEHVNESVKFKFPEELFSKLIKLGKGSDYTLHIILVSAVAVLLEKYTGIRDSIVGTPIYKQEIEGNFINTVLVLRNLLEDNMTFKELLLQAKQTIIEAVEHQNYPLETLAYKLEIPVSPDECPLFDVLILLENIHDRKYIHSLHPAIVFAFRKDEEGLEGTLEYRADSYEKTTIRRIIDHFTHLLQVMVENPGEMLKNIAIPTGQEREQILFEFNKNSQDDVNDKTVCQFIAEHAKRTPGKVAAVFREDESTYEGLKKNTGFLAGMLKKRGIHKEERVGILMERSLVMMESIIAVWAAGGAYIPMDPGDPVQRLVEIVRDADPLLLLTDREDIDAELKSACRGHILKPGKIAQMAQMAGVGEIDPVLENPNEVVDMHSLSYVIYTSGSTGKPKGAMIEHIGMMNHIRAKIRDLQISEKSIIAQTASQIFDISVWQFFTPPVAGGKTIIYPRDLILRPKDFISQLQSDRVTTLEIVPSYLSLILDAVDSQQPRLESLDSLVVTGETLRWDLVRRWFEAYPGINVINAYGPTEASDDVTHFIMEGLPQGEQIPIGKPLRNFNIYIVDENANLCPIGVQGEIWVSGIGVGRGYLNNPGLTAEKFVNSHSSLGIRSSRLSANDQCPITNGRLYKTGDRARWLPDGNIDFLGRKDSQVKIRGFRIELEEIERRLLNHEFVKEAVVLAKKDSNQDKCLVAYIVPSGAGADEGEETTVISALRQYLSRHLPDHMIPAYFVRLEEFPLSPTGKINRKALPEPERDAGVGTWYVAPHTELQRKLVGIWCEILKIEKLGIHDSFFEIGGDSITAIRVSARLQNLRLVVEINDIFEYPTVSLLEKRVRKIDRDIDQGIVEGEVELTPIQKWFFKNVYPHRHHFNLAGMLSREKGFEREIVEKVFSKILQHHDALRMIYRVEGEKIRQWNRGIDGKLFDIDVIQPGNRGDILQEIEKEADKTQGGLNLHEGPLVKLKLFKTKKIDYLLIVIHHIVADGISWRILDEDFNLGYRQALRGEEIIFQEKSDSFKYWSEKLNVYAQGEEILNELDYWRQVETAATINLPKDREVSPKDRKIKNTEMLTMTLNKNDTHLLLTKVYQAYNTEINDILLTALAMALNEWAGLEKVLVYLEGHGREGILPGVYINRTIGWFTSLFPVLLDLGEEESLGEKIKWMKESLRRIPNRGIGYGILKYLAPNSPGHSDLFEIEPQIVFNYLGQFSPGEGDHEFNIVALQIGETENSMKIGCNKDPEARRHEAINIEGLVMEEKFMLTFGYDKYEYRRSSIKKLVDCYQSGLLKIIEHCVSREETEMTISDFSVPGIAEEDAAAVYEIFDH